MASTRKITLVVIGVLAIVAAAIIAFFGGVDNNRGGQRTSPSGPSTNVSAPPADASGASTTPPSGAAGSSGDPAADGTTAATSKAPSETLPTSSGSSGAGYRLPPANTVKPAPLVGSALPAPGVAKGRLVTGFPTALAPPRGSRVESSSVSVSGATMQAGLTASGSDPQTVLAHYRKVLAARGYAEETAPGLETEPAAAFVKGRDSVTVASVDGKTYLLAQLRPSGH